MDVREWLLRPRRLMDEIERLEVRKAGAYDRATSATATLKETPGGGGGGAHSKCEPYAVLSAAVDDKREELHRLRAETLHGIRGLDDATLEELLIAYYVAGHKWADVANDMGCSRQWLNKLHTCALIKLQIIFDEG